MKVAQSCLILCDPVDQSPPDSSVHGILQARVLEWVAISFSRDLSNPGIKPRAPALQTDSLPSEPPGKPKYCMLSLMYGILKNRVETTETKNGGSGLQKMVVGYKENKLWGSNIAWRL